MRTCDDLIAVRLKDYWGFLNLQGKLIVPCQYEELQKLSLHGNVREVSYKDYLYKDIKLDAEYFNKKIKATASIGDDNLQMDFREWRISPPPSARTICSLVR